MEKAETHGSLIHLKQENKNIILYEIGGGFYNHDVTSSFVNRIPFETQKFICNYLSRIPIRFTCEKLPKHNPHIQSFWYF